jgi:hypothetical protein
MQTTQLRSTNPVWVVWCWQNTGKKYFLSSCIGQPHICPIFSQTSHVFDAIADNGFSCCDVGCKKMSILCIWMIGDCILSWCAARNCHNSC